MECILFIGIQASGKSSFYREKFARTHVRISLDLLKTRHRERRFLEICLETRQGFVVDNTNARKQDRARYIEPARRAGFKVVGYYFASRLADAVRRNALRAGTERIPEKGIAGTLARLERPSFAEGFDALYYVRLDDTAGFVIEEWTDEL